MLETAEGVVVVETIAICKYLAKVGTTGSQLLGSTPLERAKVEQWLSVGFM